jgi:hypothetical protein
MGKKPRLEIKISTSNIHILKGIFAVVKKCLLVKMPEKRAWF